jgi:hypothetical protein
VPGATVTINNSATNAVRKATSTTAGDYTFPSVAPGVCSVKAEHDGFKTSTSNNVRGQVQQSVRLNFALQIGQIHESVEVSATADLLQAENAAVGAVVENKRREFLMCRTSAETHVLLVGSTFFRLADFPAPQCRDARPLLL